VFFVVLVTRWGFF